MKTTFEYLALLLIIFLPKLLLAQAEIPVQDRITGIRYSGTLLLNTNGMSIKVEHVKKAFEINNIIQNQPIAVAKRKTLASLDPSFDFECFYLEKGIEKKSKAYATYYFAKSLEGEIDYISIVSIFPHDKLLNDEIVRAIRNKLIPESSVFSYKEPVLSLCGRNINVNNSCSWMSENSIQCPYDAQLDWSMFDNLPNALRHQDYRINVLENENRGKVVLDTLLDVRLFENVVQARKLIYDFKGLSSALLKLDGSDRLVIYYVSGRVDNYIVGCMMSFWEDKSAAPNALPPMLRKIMSVGN